MNTRSRPSTTSSTPSSLPRPVRLADRRAGCGLAVAEALGRGARSAAAGADRGRGWRAWRGSRATTRAGGVGGQLQDRLDGEARVDRHRRVRERAQLLDVLVLEPGDLLDLEVAAVDGLERREALAQELLRGQQRGVVARARACRSASWWASARSSTLSLAATASRPRS